MKHKIDYLYCDTLLSSKELSANAFGFLKPASNTIHPPVRVPETYLCDMLLNRDPPLEEFIQLLKETFATTAADILENEDGKKSADEQSKIPSPFTCVVIQSNLNEIPENGPITENVFEQRLNALKKDGKAIRQWLLHDSTLIMVLHGPPGETEKEIRSLLEPSAKERPSTYRAGAAIFPPRYHAQSPHIERPTLSVSPEQTVYNAIKALDHAAFLPPGTLAFFDDITQNIYGDRLYQLGKTEDAAAEYLKGLEIDPENINLLNSLGVCYSVMNRLDLALELFERAIELNPTDFMLLYNAGLTCNLLDDLDKGIVYLEKAISLNSSLFEAQLTAAVLMIKADRSKEAFTHLCHAVHLNPKSAMARRLLGELHLQMDQPEKAALEFTATIKLNPRDTSAISGLARAYEVQNKNLDIALDLACHSILMAPDNPYFRIRLARIYLKKGLFDFADIEFTKAEKHFRIRPGATDNISPMDRKNPMDTSQKAESMQAAPPETEKKSA